MLLTTLLTPITILSTFDSVSTRVRAFEAFMLLLETGMLGVFLAQDLFLFYIFWEFTLVPMYFLIGIWGGQRRIYAAVKFFLYTFAGSVFMLLAIIAAVCALRQEQLRAARHDARHTGRVRLSSIPSLRVGCSWLSLSPSRSRCRSGRSIRGCRMRILRRRQRARSSWQVSC